MDINSEPFFSVIIPAYNSGKTIEASIQSVLSQQFADFEVLVIDGLSSDGTVAIAKSFNNEKITVVSEADSGIYDAMNKGIKLAKGKWVYILGSDDKVYDDSIFKKINGVIEANPKSKIVFGDVYTSDGTVETFPDYGFTELLDRCICQQSIFYHCALFNNLQFDTKFKVCADWDFNMKVFVAENQPKYVELLIARYNLHGASANWQTNPEILDNFGDKKKVITRYKGAAALVPYYSWYYIKRYSRKIKAKLTWMFQ